MSEPILSIRGLLARYGDFQALFGVSFDLQPGSTLALIGANGAGKSTLLKTIVGLLRCEPDMVIYRGERIGGVDASKIVRRGIGLVPEGRQLFPSLSVEENLMIGKVRGRNGDWNLERVYHLFPILREKRKSPATMLSGGQQQMVAIGRALLTNPKLLLCDEISLGLAPKVTNEIYTCFSEIKASGMAILLVEQDIIRASKAADRFYCLLEGKISLDGNPRDYSIEDISRSYFGAGGH